MTRPMRRLQAAGWIFITGFLLHNADHARRGLDVITDHVVWAGTIVAVVAAVTLTLVFTRHPSAPGVAMAAGFGIAIGVTLSHLVPEWSAFSDPLVDGADGLTWVAVLSEVAGALLLGAAGYAAWTERPGGSRRSSASTSALAN
jgi:hypothetical protein